MPAYDLPSAIVEPPSRTQVAAASERGDGQAPGGRDRYRCNRHVRHVDREQATGRGAAQERQQTSAFSSSPPSPLAAQRCQAPHAASLGKLASRQAPSQRCDGMGDDGAMVAALRRAFEEQMTRIRGWRFVCFHLR